jgi:hypothetical protein
MTKDYETTLTDAYGDRFTLKAHEGQVTMADANPYADRDVVADLAFTPEGALQLARKLTKAAERAFQQMEG